MKRIVLDAPAFLAWFAADGSGRRLRAEYEAGLVRVIVPTGFTLDVVEAARAAHRLDATSLTRLAEELDRLAFERRDPLPVELARWIERGLDAPRASYAALATAFELPLASADSEILARAGSVAIPVGSA